MIKDSNFNIPFNKPRVLVAPLDWGLGHATRCIPVISKLLEQHCEVIIAAETAGKVLLQKEFPDLFFIDLKGYRMQYSKNKSWLPVNLLLQFPKLIYSIYAERRWLKVVIEQYKIDAVISDNRMGLSRSKVYCVYITHQLQIKTGNRFTEWVAQKIHYHFINKYNACWVPDDAGDINLAGELSHPSVLPTTPIVYLGPFSRFKKNEAEIKYNLCIILSGPEPQRSIFEKLIVDDLEKVNGNVLLVRGRPGGQLVNESLNGFVEIKNHLASDELNLVLQQSKIIICRSGYSSVMDLVKIQKQAILVPTPGQTEQEYLARYLQEQGLFLCIEQKYFSLQDALQKIKFCAFTDSQIPQNSYEKVIQDFVRLLSKDNQ